MKDETTLAAMADDIEYNIKTHKDDKGEYSYFEQINQMMAAGTTAFIIQHDHLRDELAKEAQDTPESFLEAAKEAVLSILREIHPDYEDEIRDKITVEIRGVGAVPMKSALSDYIDKLLAVKGKVIAMSDTEPFLIQAAWYCLNCKTVTETTGYKPKKCEACSETTLALDNENSKYIDVQSIKLQEHAKTHKGRDATISCVIRSREQLWFATPGQEVKATGILRAEPYRDSRLGRLRFLKRLEVISLEKDQDADIKLTPDDILRMKSLPDEPQFYEKLRESYAPHLYGLEELKEAGVIALASQGLDRPLNILLAGDPDTGKSEIMWFAVDVSHNGHKTDMARSSAVGLTVESAYDEDTKTRMATPGMLNFADMGLAGIDEFQGINAEDAKKLNGVLESKEIVSDKAGVHERLPARCAVIVTSNSEYGRWDINKNIYDNLKFLGSARAALVSRFDLIYILKDIKDEALDSKKADKIITVYGKTERPREMFMQDTPEYFGFKTMQQYFYYIVKHVAMPEVPDELNEELKQVYMNARKSDENDMVGNRYFKSIIRLARIIARILQKEYVDTSDVSRAKTLIDKSRSVAAYEPSTGKLDSNLLEGAKSKASLSKEQQFWDCFKDVDFITTEDLELALKLKEWTDAEIRKYVQQASRQGLIYSKITGQWSKA